MNNKNIDLSAYEGENVRMIDPNNVPHKVWHAELVGLNYELSKETGQEIYTYFCFCGLLKDFTKEQILTIKKPNVFASICNSCPYHMENGKVFGDMRVIDIDHEATEEYNKCTFLCECVHCGSRYLMTPPAIIKEGNKCTNPNCDHLQGFTAYGMKFKSVEERDNFVKSVNSNLPKRSESGRLIPFTFLNK